MSSCKKVYVLQDQRQLNQGTGRLEPKFDFSTAERFGELVFCLPGHVNAYDMEEAIGILKDKMAGFKPGDYIIPVGAPALMAVFGAMAADKAEGTLHILSWHGSRGCYIPILADSVWPDNAQEDNNGRT